MCFTYATGSGGVQQKDPFPIPGTVEITVANGTFVTMSTQNGQDSGITLDTSTSTGAYVIASCKATIQ